MNPIDRFIETERKAEALAKEIAKIDMGQDPSRQAKREVYEDGFRAGYLMGHAAAEGRKG